MKKILLILLISCFGLSLSATNYISISSGNWNDPNTWSTNSAPDKTVDGSDIVIITNGFTVTMTEDLILDGSAQLKILNGGTLQMGNNSNPAPTFTMKSSSNKFYIDGGQYLSRSPGSGGNLLIEKGLIDWRNGTMYVSGNYDFKSDVNDITMINMCIRVAQNILYDGIATSGNHAIMTNVDHVSGLEGTGNLTIKGSSYIDATSISLNASSNTSNLEIFDSRIEGSVYAIHGGEKIKVDNLDGNPTLDYWYGSVDGNLNDFSGSKIENQTIAQEICTSGGAPEETDLVLVKTASPSTLTAGETVTWTIVVTNDGDYAAENVSVEDVLPTQVSFVSKTVSKGSWSAPTWTIGSMAVDEVVTLTLVTTVNSGVTGNVTNEATVTTTTPETNENNNTDDATVTVNAPQLTDLVLVKTATPGTLAAGETVTWTIVVTNDGDYAAENVSVEDVLPTQVSFVSKTVSKGSWSAPTWTIGSMSVDEVVTLTLVTTVNSGVTGNVTNEATVTTTTPETNENNNTDDATVIVEGGNLENNFDGTLVYEDLWPGKGDYDFNDLVLDYDFQITSNQSNYLVKVEATFTIKAFGAGFQNGFGFQLASTIDQADITVSGYSLTENYISLNGNGTEDGQSKPTIIVYDNAYNEMQHPGVGIGVNTDPSAPYVDPKTIEILITFPADTYTISDLDIANFNPFLIVNQTRGHEVCLPNYPPTDLMDESLFGTYEDDSNPGSGKYFKTTSNLPWAFNIIDGFDYPKEKKEISTAYLHFIEWAESGGSLFPDWYMDKSGYRNSSNIYTITP